MRIIIALFAAIALMGCNSEENAKPQAVSTGLRSASTSSDDIVETTIGLLDDIMAATPVVEKIYKEFVAMDHAQRVDSVKRFLLELNKQGKLQSLFAWISKIITLDGSNDNEAMLKQIKASFDMITQKADQMAEALVSRAEAAMGTTATEETDF